MTQYEVVIVGGGPAGSTAARNIAQRGINVLLIDKDVFPRTKTCAGGLIKRTVDNLDFDITSVVQQKFYGQRMVAPSGLAIEAVKDEPVGDLVMRGDFDNLLLRKAFEAGAEIREGVKVTSIEQDKDKVTVKTDEGVKITSEYILGADGINSIVAKQLDFYDGWKKGSASLCIEVEVEVTSQTVNKVCGAQSTENNQLLISAYFGSVPYGYSWCFPKDNMLSIGAGCRQDLAINFRSNFNKWFEKFMKKYDINPVIVSDTSARVPYSGAAEKTVIGRAALLGDAAGFANPYSGEGISNAIVSGRLVAPVLENALRDANPENLRAYEKAWKHDFEQDIHASKSIAKLMFKNIGNMEAFIQMANRDEYILNLTHELVVQTQPLKEFRKSLIKRILRKHFRTGLSLYF